MARSFRFLTFAIAFLAFAGSTQAGFVLVTSRSALNPSGTFNFSDLGTNGTILSNPFNLVATTGESAIDTQSSSNGKRVDQSNGWNGNFTPGEALVLTQFGGPVTIDFGSTQLKSFGLQIQSDAFARFTAYISVLDSAGTVLAKFTRTGNSTSLANGSALFIGVASDADSSNFSRIQIGLDSGGNVSNFYYNAPSFNAVAVPEPSTYVFSALAIAGLAVIHRKKQWATRTLPASVPTA